MMILSLLGDAEVLEGMDHHTCLWYSPSHYPSMGKTQRAFSIARWWRRWE
jgi:hypothetical protein